MIFSFPEVPKSHDDVLTKSLNNIQCYLNNIECYLNNIEMKVTATDTSANMLVRMACALLRALSFMKQERQEKIDSLPELGEMKNQLKKRKVLK